MLLPLTLSRICSEFMEGPPRSLQTHGKGCTGLFKSLLPVRKAWKPAFRESGGCQGRSSRSKRHARGKTYGKISLLQDDRKLMQAEAADMDCILQESFSSEHSSQDDLALHAQHGGIGFLVRILHFQRSYFTSIPGKEAVHLSFGHQLQSIADSQSSSHKYQMQA